MPSDVTLTLAAEIIGPDTWSCRCLLCDHDQPVIVSRRGGQWQVLQQCPHFAGVDPLFSDVRIQFARNQRSPSWTGI